MNDWQVMEEHIYLSYKCATIATRSCPVKKESPQENANDDFDEQSRRFTKAGTLLLEWFSCSTPA